MSMLRKIFWALTVPIMSFLGFLKLKSISKKKDCLEWRESFSAKKVLIVGTGPSLDNVSDEYFLNFDTIVYINHAIKCSGKVEDEYFFSTDVDVVKGIADKPYFKKIETIGNVKSVLAPIFFQQVFFLKNKFKKSFSWLVASEASYKIHRISKSFFDFNFPVTAVFWPKQPDIEELDIWFSQKQQVCFFPVVESTSALSAILFVAKYRPLQVSLIGCDFGVGRSKSIVEDCPVHNVNVFSEARHKFNYIKNYLSNKNILLINESWS